MAYGKSRKLAGSTRSRAKRVSLPRAPKTNRNYVRKNAKAVNSLYRSVRNLKMSQYGSKQVGYHKMTTHVTPIARAPVLFDMLDFSVRHPANGVQVPSGYFYQISTAGALSQVAGWESCQPTNLFWADEKTDIPDTGKMFACDMDYTFRIEGIDSLDDTRVRIDVFQQKMSVYYARPNTAVGGILALPHALAALDNMATPTLNRINSLYFKKVKTIWKYFNSHTGGVTTQTTPNIQYASFRMKPNMLIQQLGTVPAVVNNPSDVPVTGGQWGIYNKPLRQSLWCLISTDDATAALPSDAVRVTVTRKVVYRDHVGAAGLDGGAP